MRQCLRAALARLVRARMRGARLVLSFDYDGTLVPIVEHPSRALLSKETRHRLERLALTPSVILGVLSGRAIDDVRHRVGIASAYYAGTSGLEMSFGHTLVVRPKRAQGTAYVAVVASPIRRTLAGYAGAWAEQKPLGLTVHYRNVIPSRIEALRTDVADIVSAASGKLRMVDGAMALEITPNVGWTKGAALRRMVEHIQAATVLPLYAGDDANDADALLAAAELGGVAIGIGPHAPPTAQYRLPHPASLGGCLDTLLEMLADPETVKWPGPEARCQELGTG